MKRFVFIGAPGSGKGTQSDLITSKYGIPKISTGEIFRSKIADGTPLGLQIKEQVSAGILLPDDLVVNIVSDRLHKDDTKDGWILDGFPRTIAQADGFEKTLAVLGENIDRAIYISVPVDILIKRITGRQVCRDCGKTYNKETFPTKVPGVCDACGGPVEGRSDDSVKTAKKRIQRYEKSTKPLIEYYRSKGLLSKFDGTKSAEEVFAEIEKLINT